MTAPIEAESRHTLSVAAQTRTALGRFGPMVEDAPPNPFSDGQKRAWLAALARKGTVRGACAVSGVERGIIYYWRERDPEFAAAWEAALEDFADGIEEGIYEVGQTDKGMPRLIALLAGAKRFRPQYWVEKRQEQHDVNVTIRADDVIGAILRARSQPPAIEGEARVIEGPEDGER